MWIEKELKTNGAKHNGESVIARCAKGDCDIGLYDVNSMIVRYRQGAKIGDNCTFAPFCPVCLEQSESLQHGRIDARVLSLPRFKKIIGRAQQKRCEGCGEKNDENTSICSSPNGWVYYMCPECLIENDEEMMYVVKETWKE